MPANFSNYKHTQQGTLTAAFQQPISLCHLLPPLTLLLSDIETISLWLLYLWSLLSTKDINRHTNKESLDPSSPAEPFPGVLKMLEPLFAV